MSTPPRPTTQRLSVAAAVALTVWALGAGLSIAARWPAQFGGPGDPDAVAGEFVARGTATAPPLPLLAVVAALALLARSRRWWGTAAVAGLCLVAGLTLVGSLGEALAPPTPDVPRAVLVASGAVGAAVSLALLAAGALELRDRWRARRGAGRTVEVTDGARRPATGSVGTGEGTRASRER